MKEDLGLLPLSFLLLFLGALAAEDLVQEAALSLAGLESAFEVAGLTKGPHFLKIDC